ncbi:thioredoxin 1 [Salirhabdus euzebyi]|uniref:Thioredoxin 1 n=1 Tax=Salirhabdus euzebyi TaxID=394506 RepID=A0A841PUJ1_9BACI|nr:thioredoxin 1 [Salirhabdus euzebyi]
MSEELSSQVDFYNVDVKIQEEMAQKFEVQGLPTLVLLKNGKEIDRLVGLAKEEEIKIFANQ